MRKTFSLRFFEVDLKGKEKGKPSHFFHFTYDNVSMPKIKCDENATEKNCGIYSIHCVYIEMMLLVANSLQR
jgi:hypothetical protein